VGKTEQGETVIRSWYIVGTLSLLYACSIVDRLIMSISIGPVRHSLGISDFQISLTLGLAFTLFYTLCGLPLGVLVDRFPRRRVIFFGMLVWSAAASACGLATTGTQLFTARMFVGAGEAALSPAAYSILSDLFPRSRLAAPISVYTIGGTLGSAFALAVGGPLLQYLTVRGGWSLPGVGTLQPWQALFVATGLPGLAAAWLIFTFKEPTRRASDDSRRASDSFVSFLKTNWQLLSLLFVGFGAAAMLPYGLSSWIPALMMRSYGLGPAAVGKTYGLIVALCGVGAHGFNGFTVDWLFRRRHPDAHLRFFVVSAVVATPVVVSGFLSGRWLWLLLGVTTAHLVLTPFVGYAAAALQIITPSQMRGRMSALFLFVISAFGLGLGPSVVAGLTDFLFRSESRLGEALATFVAVCAGSAALALGLACRRFRLAVAAASSTGSAAGGVS
jgi:MFS family permease